LLLLLVPLTMIVELPVVMRIDPSAPRSIETPSPAMRGGGGGCGTSGSRGGGGGLTLFSSGGGGGCFAPRNGERNARCVPVRTKRVWPPPQRVRVPCDVTPTTRSRPPIIASAGPPESP